MLDAAIAIYGSTPPLPSVVYTGTIVHKLSVNQQFNIATSQPIETATAKIEKFYVDVDYHQLWCVRGRNWLTGAFESRYGSDTSVNQKPYATR